MKRLCPLLLLLCLLLSGCGRNAAAERFAPFSAALAARRDLRFDAEVRAEYDDRTARYTLRYEDEPVGCKVTVLSPEEIRGLTVHFDGAESSLGYDAVVLDTGPLDRYGLSPASALPALARALREGHLESAWTEEDMTVWELVPDDHLSVLVWLDEDLTPLRAELVSEGRVAVFCEFTDWE